MGTSEIKISQAPEALSRPSLLSTGAPSADHNILDAMAGRSERAEAGPRPRRLWWWLLPLLAATAWGISTQLSRPPAERLAPTAAVQPASPAPAAVVTAPVPVAADPASTSTAQATATLPANGASPDPFHALADAPETTPALPASSPQANPLTGLQAAMATPAATPMPPQPAPSTDKPSNTTVARQKPAAPQAKVVPQAAAPSQSKTATAAARKTPAPKTHAQAGATQKQQTKPTASAKAGTRDPDVELLSAIMKHLGSGKGAADAAAPTRSPQTIAELVKSCRTKDAIEALLCQRRICEGSWGKAQACPREQAPNAAKTASPT